MSEHSTPVRSSDAAASSETRRVTVSGRIILACGAVVFLLPVNFVSLTGSWTLVDRAVSSTVLVVGTFALAGAVRDAAAARAALFAAAVVFVLGAISTGQVVAQILVLVPLVVGFVLGLASRSVARLTLTFVVVVVGASCVLEALLGAGWVAGQFGSLLRPPLLGVEFRARGISGHPIPSAVLTLCAGAPLIYLMRARRSRAVGELFVATTILVTVLITGTRSALPLMAAGGLGLFVMARLAVRTKASTRLQFWIFGLAAAVALWPIMWPVLAATRALDFAALEGTDSLSNRLYASRILGVWADECHWTCTAFGSGPRDLESALIQSLGLNDLSTVDNFYVTALWDFGVLGFLLLVIALVFGARRMISSGGSDLVRAGALGLVLILLSGLVFDSLYTRPVLILFGVCLAWACAGDESFPAESIAEGSAKQKTLDGLDAHPTRR